MKYITSGATILATAFVIGLSITPAFAVGDWPPGEIPGHGGGVTRVPEIDAASGVAALAAVAAALAFARERRRGKG